MAETVASGGDAVKAARTSPVARPKAPGRAMNPSEPDQALRYVYDRGTPYEHETRVTQALDALIPDDALMHPDQRFFQLVHLVTEYYWCGIHYELRRVATALDGDDYPPAVSLLDRAAAMAEGPRHAVELLQRCLSQFSLLQMRQKLPPGATGFDSPGGQNLRRVAGPVWRAFERALERRDLSVTALAMQRMEAAENGRALADDLAWLAAIYDGLQSVDTKIMEWRQSHVQLAWTQVGGAPHGEYDDPPPPIEREPESLRGRPIADLAKISAQPFFPKIWGIPTVIFSAMTDGHGRADGHY